MNAATATNHVDRARRDGALDMVKGMLVIGMLLIHSSGIFLESVALRRLIYPELLGFVSGSWLFLSGYLLGLRYRPSFASAPAAVTWRLLNRGWRLAAIFVVSNLVLGRINPVDCLSQSGAGRCDLVNIFLIGDHALAFEVLLGISYVLMIAPLCLWLPMWWMTLLVSALVVLLTIVQAAGFALPMLSWMLACGLAGILLGAYLQPGDLQRLLMTDRRRTILCAVAVWALCKVLVRLNLVGMVSPVFYIAQIGAVLSVLYIVGYQMVQVGWINRPMTVMAHYSLLAYMGQMSLLQFWNWLVPAGSWLDSFVSSLVVVFVLLLGGLYLLAYLRERFKLVDAAYRAAFG